MKIVIGCLNSKFIHASLAPWCLAAGVNAFCEEDIDCTVLESTINGDINLFAEEILKTKPQLISFSCYIWNIEQTLELCKILKKNSAAKIVLGGPEVSYRAKDVLDRYPFIDLVLSGEGEYSFPVLLSALINKKSLSTVSGLNFRENERVVSIPEESYSTTPPSPYSDKFFENLNGRIAYIESSRGCPFSCAFCLSGRCSPLRFFDIESTKRNILLLANSGTKTVKFVDRTFNANKNHCNQILSFIIESYGKEIPSGVCFHFEIAGDILSKDTLEILKSAPKGLFQLEIGMQSFNAETLAKINRKTNTKRLIENIKALLSFNNMHIHIDLIAGLVGEDIKSFEESFNIGFSLRAHMLQMGFLKLLYGAEMRENAEKYPCEFSEKPPYEVISTPVLSANEIISLKKCEDALERLYNSGRFLRTIDFILNSTDYTPFKLFFDFGQSVSGQRVPLYDYAAEVYEFFKNKCDPTKLRDALVMDLISSSSSPKIPECLKVSDPLYKKAKKFLTMKYGVSNLAILYGRDEIFWTNPKGDKDFYGRFEGNFMKKSFILDLKEGL